MPRIFAPLALFLAPVFVLAGTVAQAEPLLPSSAVPAAPEWLVAPQDPELAPLRRPSYFEQHAARVERDMLFFDRGYTLDRMRERDELRLYDATPGTNSSTAAAISIFSTAVVSSAHTPRALKFAFDRSFHLGPAILDGGGMGAGLGGRIW